MNIRSKERKKEWKEEEKSLVGFTACQPFFGYLMPMSEKFSEQQD